MNVAVNAIREVFPEAVIMLHVGRSSSKTA